MQSSKNSIIYGITSICYCYIYFLIFAQFSFLELFKASEGLSSINTIMGIMGASGMIFSFITIRLLATYSASSLLKIGFFGCSVSSLLGVISSNTILFYLDSMLIGSSLAMVTVSLASILLTLFPLRRIGLYTGAGTGLAYFVCNLPMVFESSSSGRSLFSAIICAIMALLPITRIKIPIEDTESRQIEARSYFTPLLLLLALTALVWYDSGAFYIIQQSPSYKSLTWHGPFRLLLNAFVHLSVAVVAGFLIDKRYLVNCLIAAHISISLGVMALSNIFFSADLASVFYCAGVSIYSTALVLAPSLFTDSRFSLTNRHRAGILYAIAGWFGSAMGIGMAQDLNRVPVAFIALSGLLMIVFKVFTSRSRIMFLFIFGVPFISAQAKADDSIDIGRKVYISEGCINCHSQFVRPIEKDIEFWGPYVDYKELLKGSPPLIGNRRQGPDLLNIGNRRNREWLKLHFIKPRELLPWSRMPSYKYLFEDNRGEALLDYLQSLGKETIPERLEYIKSWLPNPNFTIKADTIRSLYDTHCSQCHGSSADGNGPLAKELATKPRPLNRKPYAYVDFNSPDYLKSLSRIIKFGIIGTSMAGHEYLSDEELVGLAQFLDSLSK